MSKESGKNVKNLKQMYVPRGTHFPVQGLNEKQSVCLFILMARQKEVESTLDTLKKIGILMSVCEEAGLDLSYEEANTIVSDLDSWAHHRVEQLAKSQEGKS